MPTSVAYVTEKQILFRHGHRGFGILGTGGSSGGGLPGVGHGCRRG